MGFQIKNFVSIAAGMLNHVRGVASGLTDFNVGAIGRTLLEGAAVEIEETYRQMFDALRDAIPVATYQSFNFDRLDAAPSNGLITVTVAASSADVTIPKGTIFSTTAARTTFVSQADVTITAGNATGDVSVIAADAGLVGNVPASTQFTASPTIANFVSASNAKLFNNGRDLETDDERKQRFNAYIDALQRAHNDALIYGAKTVALFNAAGIETERAKTANIVEPYLSDNTQPIAWVKVYVHNGVGSTSATLVSQVDTVLRGYVDSTTGKKVPGWVAAGVKMDVLSATEVPYDITGKITAEPGYDVNSLLPLAVDALTRHLLDLDIAATSQLMDRILLVANIEGVANVVFTVGTADKTSAATEKLMPGTITITAGP